MLVSVENCASHLAAEGTLGAYRRPPSPPRQGTVVPWTPAREVADNKN